MIKKYQIDLPVFSGPLDLLLHLIERQELDITAVSLANVTAQYLKQVEHLKGNRMEQLIDFLVVAARLVLIKSRALLPQTPVIIEGEEEEDPAEALLRQLKLYKQFKTAAKWFKEREEAGLRTYLRVAPPPKMESRLDMSGVTLEMLITAVQAALARAESREDSVSIIQPRRITIEGQIKKLRYLVKRGKHLRFNDLLSENVNRVEVSITLLALLELIKRHEISAVQPELFGPIEILPYQKL
ncbi:MAG: segregation/condensation protein A [Chloroflexi bacterium]|nr:segregation/condensation protein A [Chloroflexota bacterium]